MALENKLGLTSSADLAREEELISKKNMKAIQHLELKICRFQDEKSSQHCSATPGGFHFSIKYLLPSNICLPHLSIPEVARNHFLQASSCPDGCCMVLPPC